MAAGEAPPGSHRLLAQKVHTRSTRPHWLISLGFHRFKATINLNPEAVAEHDKLAVTANTCVLHSYLTRICVLTLCFVNNATLTL